jgi:subtilase family serine protease
VTLDVEWAHAMAPAAKIVLVTATNRGSLDEAINLAVVHHYGNTISNSWSSIEGLGNPAQYVRVNRILQSAAAQGIDVNFSSGDYGDERVRVGFVSVDFPGSSPFATSIGGTSLALSNGKVMFETGWGTNLTRIADVASKGSAPVVPPNNDPALGLGFQFGAGGGPSLTFAKPAWQAALPGTTRQTPDIGMLADPFTGVEIIETVDGELTVGVIGGTSLACPVFSGIMALAAQRAGHGIGQVAPLLYGLGSVIRDVPAVGSATNVSGSINGTVWTADQLAAPLFSTKTYYSALYQSPFSTRWFVITFGTDTGLVTGPGWDNVTGLGVPDAAALVAAIAQR